MNPVSNNFALIVGVERYARYSQDRAFDVSGAIADARAHYRQCLSAGFSPDRIRVLSTPRLAPADLGPEATAETVGDADHAGIVAGLTWLVERLSGEAAAAGLFTFSGHGLLDGGVALCPSDLTPSLAELIHVAGLRLTLHRRGLHKAAEELTMLLDCCHAQVGLAPEEQIQARLWAQQKKLDLSDLGQRTRVIAACSREGTAESSCFGGTRMGAFTWAITSAMGQWSAVETDGVRRLTVSHGELVARTNALLEALSFPQRAVLSGPPGLSSAPFLGPRVEPGEGETSPAPTGERGTRQLDVGYYKFELQYATLEVFAWVIVRNGQEVWQLNANSQTGTPSSLKVSYWPTMPQGQGFPTITVLSQSVAWSTAPKAVPGSAQDKSLLVFCSTSAKKGVSMTAPVNGLSTVEWFSATRGNLSFDKQSISYPAVTTLNRADTSPGVSYYYAQVSVNR